MSSDLGDSIVFYCKDCEELVDTTKVPGKFVYKCKKCGTKNVAFGTEKSIQGFFRLEDEKGADKAKPEVKASPEVKAEPEAKTEPAPEDKSEPEAKKE